MRNVDIFAKSENKNLKKTSEERTKGEKTKLFDHL